MIVFRRKEFSIKFQPKEWAKSLGETIKENPLTATNTVLSVSALGINMKRRDNEKKFQREQIKATNDLVKAIEDSQSKDGETKEVLKKKKRTLKRSQKPYTRDYYLPKPVEDLKENIKTRKDD